jgi:flagellar assembly protein FliH
MEESIVTLAIMVAEKIIEQEITGNSEIVIRQVKKALESLDNETIFKIHIHPENIDVLEQAKSQLFTDAELRAKVQLIPDTSVDAGGCILETSAGTIDARIRSQLDKLSNQIEDIAKLPPEI